MEAPAEPAEPAAKLLEQAQVAYAEGDRAQAISLALAAAQRGGGRAAWRFLGSAACQVRDARLATRAYRHLPEEDRTFVLGLCRRQQLEYVDGAFRTDPWTAP
ncbi:MAG: hypothetical protein NZ890_14865 [Myxococcota bacterium]|nr:hypothetical protein [Myxococcota bacterium]